MASRAHETGWTDDIASVAIEPLEARRLFAAGDAASIIHAAGGGFIASPAAPFSPNYVDVRDIREVAGLPTPTPTPTPSPSPSPSPSPTPTPTPAPRPGSWQAGPALPIALGEIAGGIIGNKLYIVGQGSDVTLAYDFAKGTWSDTTSLARRPLVGDHHAAEVIDGQLYLIGGLYEGGQLTNPSGIVEIYDPATNTWSIGANVPWKGGSISTAVIGGQVYAAGGVVNADASNPGGTGSTNLAARYNPSTNTWTMLASMPRAANHAAAATDGKKLYIFGGRGGPNFVGNGFATVQVYDPATNSWTSSDSSSIQPLPIGRGGTGKAVFYKGEFYVFGGETANGPGATSNHVYNRVDIYNPTTNTWRQGTSIPIGVHGIFPLLHGTQVLVPGGGTHSGFSQSKNFQIYTPG